MPTAPVSLYSTYFSSVDEACNYKIYFHTISGNGSCMGKEGSHCLVVLLVVVLGNRIENVVQQQTKFFFGIQCSLLPRTNLIKC